MTKMQCVENEGYFFVRLMDGTEFTTMTSKLNKKQFTQLFKSGKYCLYDRLQPASKTKILDAYLLKQREWRK